MSIESNKALIRRFFDEAVNQRKLNIFEDLCAANYVNHDMPAPAPGPAGLRAVLNMFIEAFPDLHITLLDVIGEGDRVFTHGQWTGTHKGAFMGVPATGKRVSVQFMDKWRIENGKAAENWVRMDMLGLMQQFGVVPSAG